MADPLRRAGRAHWACGRDQPCRRVEHHSFRCFRALPACFSEPPAPAHGRVRSGRQASTGSFRCYRGSDAPRRHRSRETSALPPRRTSTRSNPAVPRSFSTPGRSASPKRARGTRRGRGQVAACRKRGAHLVDPRVAVQLLPAEHYDPAAPARGPPDVPERSPTIGEEHRSEAADDDVVGTGVKCT